MAARAKTEAERLVKKEARRKKANIRSTKWQKENKEKVKEAQKRYRQKHLEKRREDNAVRMRLYRDKNPEKALAASRKYLASPNGKAQHRLNVAARDYRIKCATVAWANKDKIKEVYEIASLLTLATGEAYEVDHVIPLLGKRVCGLHVETNLQVLTAKENRKKSNAY